MSGAVSPGREVALRVLQRVGEGAYADRAFAAEARKARLDPRERAFGMRLAYGAVQRSRTLDWMVDQVVDRPRGLETSVRDVMRLGAYQLAFLDGVSAPAAVDQSVRQARGLRGSRARRAARGGLVNAALRSLSGETDALMRDLADESAGLRHSLPDWIVAGLESSLGERAEGVMAALNEPAESALRWNRLRGPRASLEAELPSGRWHRDGLVPEAYVLEGGFALEDSEAWARGRAMAQSRASMLPARVLAPQPGERILDLCAAPGAKATHLAALAPGAQIVAVELHASRAEGLRRLARRMGAKIQVVEGDAREVTLAGGFDAALVDPPCTGLGVLSARPDARWRRRAEALPPLLELQRGLLARALDAVRPGGRVVYSTCTLLSAENEEVVAATGAGLDDLGDAYPTLRAPDGSGALMTLPGRDDTDGFYIARLEN